MSGYIYFTDEQKQRANSVDLVGFLKLRGEKLTRSGREWRWERHDSVTVRDDQWFQHSTEQGGHAIDFVQEFYHIPFPEAVTLLLGGEKGVEFRQADQNKHSIEQKPFILPEANSDMRRVFAYLIKQRFLDRDVLSVFAKAKTLYEDNEYHNAVFVGCDETGVARHAHKKGTYSNGKSYRVNVEGSDPRYSFHFIGSDEKLYVFEAPIDLLSFITLNKGNWQMHSYVALDGVSEQAMLHQLTVNPQLKNILLCLDHDPAGIEATGRLLDILQEHGYYQISYLQPSFKDWNEILKSQNGVTSIPAQEHPKIEACRELCGKLVESCENSNTSINPQYVVLEYAQKITPHFQNGKIVQGKENVAMELLQSMAVNALLSVQRQYRQLGKQVTMEQLTDQLFKSYKVYQDRSGLRSKVDDIKKDATEIYRQIKTPGIRSLDDKENMIKSYMSLALNCVKAHIFIDLECQKQLLKQEQSANFSMAM